MFTENLIAQIMYQVYIDKHNKEVEIEGVTVQVPNLIDRVLYSLRVLLAGCTANLQRPGAALTHRGVQPNARLSQDQL